MDHDILPPTLLSWLVTHTLFAFRCAHEFYQTPGLPGAMESGFEFPLEGCRRTIGISSTSRSCSA